MENKPWDSALEEEVARKISEQGYIRLSEVYEVMGIQRINLTVDERDL